jgi:hypothetical protein
MDVAPGKKAFAGVPIAMYRQNGVEIEYKSQVQPDVSVIDI